GASHGYADHVFERIRAHLDGTNARLDAHTHDGVAHTVGVVRDEVAGAKVHPHDPFTLARNRTSAPTLPCQRPLLLDGILMATGSGGRCINAPASECQTDRGHT